MQRSTDASELLQLRASLKKWAIDAGTSSAHIVVNDLAELCRAAEATAAAIRALPVTERMETAKRLVEIQSWLYDELLDHAEKLRIPLQTVSDDVYKTS